MVPLEDYCELNRKFVPLISDGKEEAIASNEIDFAFLRWRSKGWDKLHESEGSVVILGEPGSGRSYEFRKQCEKLNAAGQRAFYLEFHRLVGRRIETILADTPEGVAYENWIRSSGKACFFLDAVDEAKLDKVLDFEAALENFRSSLGRRLGDVKVYLSSRISSWNPEGDKRLVETNLTPPEDGRDKSSNNNPRKNRPIEISVYVICPLSREAVSTLCASNKLVDPESFLEAVDRSHALEFVRRPLDVSFLIRYWKQSGRIGSLIELSETTVRELLKEREEKQDHARSRPLAPEHARLGAESMAAASVFCRTLDFFVGDASRGQRRALSPMECLPENWDSNQCNALIDRPLFESAIYGTFRFHHRRIAEYLAACWLKRRMENQCPTPVLRDLLFSVDSDRMVLRPSMGAVAAWLACLSNDRWSEELRGWLLRASPEVFLRYGDPSVFPAGFKRAIIKAFAARYKDRNYLNIETERSAMSRLADGEMGGSLAATINDSTMGDGPKLELLTCATESHCVACIPAAFRILQDRTNDKALESKAIELIGAAGSAKDLERMKARALSDVSFSHDHLGWLVRFLFPHALSVEELRILLLTAPDVERLSSQRYFVRSVFDKKLEGRQLVEVLSMLCDLNKASLRCRSTDQSPSYPCAWTKDLIYPLLRSVLRGPKISTADAKVVGSACAIISLPSRHSDHYESDEDSINLDLLTRPHPEVRRTAFWLAVEADQRDYSNRNTSFSGKWALSHVLDFKLTQEDQSWLQNDLRLQETTFNLEVAGWLLFDIWDSYGRGWREGYRLIQRIQSAELNHVVFRKRMLRTLAHWPPDWYWHLKRKGFFSKWYWMQRRGYFRRISRSLRNRWVMHTRINRIRSGEYCGLLVQLCRQTESSTNWAVKDWSGLKRKYGHRITVATQTGCVRVWERFTPELKGEGGTPNGVIAGLSGLQFLYQEGKLDFIKMRAEDVHRAARYAVNEMNGHGDWLVNLSKSHPAETKSVLLECVESEWVAPSRKNFWCRHLELLADKDTAYSHLINEDVMKLYMTRLPGSSGAITAAFKLLTTHGRYPSAIFAARACEVLERMDAENELYLPWMAILVQTDAGKAINILEEVMANSNNTIDPRSNLIVRLCVTLLGRRDTFPMIQAPDYFSIRHIERFIRLVYQYVNPGDDIPRPSGEGFTPEARDDAQSFRGSLIPKLANSRALEAEGILKTLREDPSFQEEKDWIEHLLDKWVEQQAESEALTPQDIRDFVAKNECPPGTDRDLFNLVLRRLASIRHDVEDADESIRDNVRDGDKEVVFRRFIARELNRRKNGLYTSTQESVIREEKRLDIRIENLNCKSHVVIEAKIGSLDGRSITSLIGDLESQLCQRYLRDQNARFGIYLIACTKNRSWRNPSDGSSLSFAEVIDMLQQRADEIRVSSPGIDGFEVVGIDFRL